MKNKIFTLFLISTSFATYSQVGIGTKTPNNATQLEITADNRGILIPRVSLQSSTDDVTITNGNVNSLLVFNTSTIADITPGYYYWYIDKWKKIASSDEIGKIIAGKNVTIDGTGTEEDPYIINSPVETADETPSDAIISSATTVAVPSTNVQGAISDLATELKMKWDIKGNSGTVAGINFVGTTDDIDLIFKRNNFISGVLAQDNTSFGYRAMPAVNASAGGTNNVALGTDAMFKNITGSNNIAMGYQSLYSNTSGNNNTSLGKQALMVNNANENVAVGFRSLFTNTTGGSNTAVGKESLFVNNAGNNNTAIGKSALYKNISGNNNTASGVEALYNNLDSNNVALGFSAMKGVVNGTNNIGIGYQAGTTHANMDESIVIGANAKASANGERNQIVIGYNAVGKGSNTVQIGNANMTSIGGQVAWSNPSDIRLKKDIVSSTHGLDFISKLRPVTYYMKTGTQDLQSGFIAQEVEAAANKINYQFSGIVKPANDNEFYSLRYSEFVVPLVKAVQEQQELIEKQNNKISDLETRLLLLEKAINK
ncbi:tail fiber domain-containing protein [Flavobacterium sharifuzzamanii]|uniref:tail fiber domain-containing protein n=1 Tax=Flavobacterium sharifuzzamanii TaxID=2211133 RepID=UPI0013005E56|nr:tail fiber domain-containing protein [Flavobacterium sharifuzzamanii]KAF2082639.1 hypothetical protein DMA14_03170 [Flavobacterium sharifuzzamanii]